MNYENKYLKYKTKYLKLKNNMIGGIQIVHHKISEKLDSYLYDEPGTVNFSEISESIRDIKFTKNYIFIYYSDFVIAICFPIDCCEESWFELLKSNQIIEHTESSKYHADKLIHNKKLDKYYIKNDIKKIEKIKKEFNKFTIYDVIIDKNNIFKYKENKNKELTKPKELIRKQIKNISYCGNINIPHSEINKHNFNDYDENKVYKINTKDSKYFYFLLRTASNGYYHSNANTIKLTNQQYYELIK